MPTYMTLFHWTQKGIENAKDSPSRLDKARKLVESAGGKMHAFYMTMGQYDGAVIVEAPNDEAVAKVMLTIGGQGGIRSETFRAFTEDEYRKITGSL